MQQRLGHGHGYDRVGYRGCRVGILIFAFGCGERRAEHALDRLAWTVKALTECYQEFHVIPFALTCCRTISSFSVGAGDTASSQTRTGGVLILAATERPAMEFHALRSDRRPPVTVASSAVDRSGRLPSGFDCQNPRDVVPAVNASSETRLSGWD